VTFKHINNNTDNLDRFKLLTAEYTISFWIAYNSTRKIAYARTEKMCKKATTKQKRQLFQSNNMRLSKQKHQKAHTSALDKNHFRFVICKSPYYKSNYVHNGKMFFSRTRVYKREIKRTRRHFNLRNLFAQVYFRE